MGDDREKNTETGNERTSERGERGRIMRKGAKKSGFRPDDRDSFTNLYSRLEEIRPQLHCSPIYPPLGLDC